MCNMWHVGHDHDNHPVGSQKRYLTLPQKLKQHSSLPSIPVNSNSVHELFLFGGLPQGILFHAGIQGSINPILSRTSQGSQVRGGGSECHIHG